MGSTLERSLFSNNSRSLEPAGSDSPFSIRSLSGFARYSALFWGSNTVYENNENRLSVITQVATMSKKTRRFLSLVKNLKNRRNKYASAGVAVVHRPFIAKRTSPECCRTTLAHDADIKIKKRMIDESAITGRDNLLLQECRRFVGELLRAP